MKGASSLAVTRSLVSHSEVPLATGASGKMLCNLLASFVLLQARLYSLAPFTPFK